MSKSGVGRVLSNGLMIQFYLDHCEVLLPIYLRRGVEEFAKKFCDTYAAQPGQGTSALIQPKQIAPAFTDYFADHERFYKIAKDAFAVVGDGMTDKDVEAFHAIIKESSEFNAVMKSKNLEGRQRRIICWMMLPTQIGKSVQNSEIFTDMFEDEFLQSTHKAPGKATDKATDSDIAIEAKEEDEVVVFKGKSIPAKNPERAKCIEVMQALTKATKTSAELADVKVDLVIEGILKKYPELEAWVVENQKWIRQKHSVVITRHRPKVSVSDTEVASVAKTEKPSNAKSPKAKVRKGKVGRGGKKPKSPERAKALKIINRLQGKKGRFYPKFEMMGVILKKFPELEVWLQEKPNQTWLSTTLCAVRYRLLGKTRGQSKEVVKETPQPKSTTPEVKPTKTRPEASHDSDDLFAKLATIITDMRSGTVAPVEIIRRGQRLNAELKDFKAKLAGLESAYDEAFSAYEQLGIKV